jgi:tRNA threonylcarbamoyladenosine biosynthesis protein TsaB
MGIIGIDTAGPVPGIGYIDEHTEFLWSQRLVKGADVLLLEQLSLLSEQHTIDLIGISIGPGSFTSLRVGVALALGFAQARGIKVVPISSLKSRAAMFPHEYCLSLLDARRGKVYAQAFDSTCDVPTALTMAADTPLETMLPKQSFIAVGEGAAVYIEAIRAAGGFVPLDATRSSAVAVARLAQLQEEFALDPKQVSIQYIRGASVVPPKQLGQPVGLPSASIQDFS